MSDLVVMPADKLTAIVTAAVADVLATMAPPAEGAAPAADGGIVPTRVYTAEEAADVLGLSRKQTMFEIPEAELPRRRIGPRRGATRFLGCDLLRYVLGLPPCDDEPGPAEPAPRPRARTEHVGGGDRPPSARRATLTGSPTSSPMTPTTEPRRKRLI